ncbi:conserved hypothetical protein [Alteracholeplasma palmae J233]|uniref:Uncharacterized protein n=1 Tax=Alteracholeplasma palmae (strain ATCC 49389 / J233) TaxID=1318466 RepID=U4KK85_ALTPJ|nr:DUF6054 family protein [Alteracholeplasma palmae]CCV63918.1 conserved hypothetical protein [Alteracholeplasma palmae J233]
MAKYEKYGKGNFDAVVSAIHQAAVNGSATSSLEESTNRVMGDTKIAIRAYERYAYFGKNRSSLCITVYGNNDGDIFVSAIATGGSQAVFFKVNTWSDESFLKTVIPTINNMVK